MGTLRELANASDGIVPMCPGCSFFQRRFIAELPHAAEASATRERGDLKAALPGGSVATKTDDDDESGSDI
eukprot:9325766-Alexandrium_andersonii.AAC.1